MTDGLHLLCVDDQRAFVDSLAIALAAEDAITLVRTAADVDGALGVIERERIDVVLMDVDLPKVDGIEGARRVKRVRPETRVIVLTAFPSIGNQARAIGAGVDAYLSKDARMDEIAAAVTQPPDRPLELGRRAVESLRDSVEPVVDAARRMRLTDREREILALLAGGMNSALIARQLHIGPQTCRGYIRNLLTKLGAHSQLEAVAMARERNLISRAAG